MVALFTNDGMVAVVDVVGVVKRATFFVTVLVVAVVAAVAVVVGGDAQGAGWNGWEQATRQM